MTFQIRDILNEVNCETIYGAKLEGFCEGFTEAYRKIYPEVYEKSLVEFLEDYRVKCYEDGKSEIMRDFVKTFKDRLTLEELSEFSGLAIEEIKNF